MTSPDIIELLKKLRWSASHFWPFLHNLALPLSASLAEVYRRWIKRRNARMARNWPAVDGKVMDTHVNKLTRFFGSAQRCNAVFKYSYSVHEGGEVNYFSGEFSRTFPDEDRAWEWLWLLKGKQIRVHIKPEHPEISAVLTFDLDAHFPLPARSPADFNLSSSGFDPQ